jgi:hypothetical protein
MTFGETVAGSSVESRLLGAGLAWWLISAAVAAAEIRGSRAAALVDIVGVGAYVTVATRYVRPHREPPRE